MATTTVNDSSELATALSGASGGDIIECNSGSVYAIQTSYSFASEVIVRSANAESPAEFSHIEMTGADYLTFEDLYCKYDFVSGQGERQDNYEIINSDHIVFKRCDFEGDLATESDGDELYINEPAGKALVINSSRDCQVIDCEFHTWWSGLFINEVQGSTNSDTLISGCQFYNIRADSIAFGKSTDCTIEWCYFRDMFDGSGTEHRDMIQLRGAGGVITRPTIKNCIFDKGTGAWTQTIFSGIDGRGSTEWHLDATITDNIIYNSQTHAITLDKFDGGTISGNTIIQVDKDASQTGGGTTPQINMTDGTKNITIQDNIAPVIGGTSIGNNTTTSNSTVTSASYGTEFDELATYDVDGYNQYAFKSGGTLESAGDGAQTVNDNYTFDNLTWIRNRGVLSSGTGRASVSGGRVLISTSGLPLIG
jgi:hypothetical protein